MNEIHPSYGGAASLYGNSSGVSIRSLLPLAGWLLLPLVFYSTNGAVPVLMQTKDVELGGAGVSGPLAVAGMAVVAFTMLVSLWMMLPYYKTILMTFVRETPIAFLTLWALLSAAWSQMPDMTVRKWAWLMVGTLFAVYLVKCLSSQQLCRALMLVGAVDAMASIVLSIVLPSYGVEQGGPNAGDWQGIFAQKNAAGIAMVFLMTPVFIPSEVSGVKKSHRYLYGFLLLFMIVMTKSRTSLAVVALYLGLMFALKVIGKFPRLQIVLLVSLGIAVLLGMFGYVSTHLDSFTGMMGRDATFTGRTEIWAAAMRSIAKRPYLGYGYNAFWLGLQGESANLLLSVKFLIIHAHNGFINLWLDLGIVGVLGSIWIFLRAGKNILIAFRRDRSPMVDWYIGLVFLTLLYNIDESFILRTLNLEWVLFLVACVGLSEAARETVFRIKEAQQQHEELIYSSR